MDQTVAATIEKFFGGYRVRHYSQGQVLILNGDNPNLVYNLVSGRVKQCDVTYRGDEIILNVFKPPAFFLMSLAINGGENQFTYIAETDIEIRQVPADEVVQFLKLHPEVTFDLLSRVYQGIEGILRRMSHLMASSAKGRLMFELLIACRRFGEKADDGSVTLYMKETDLGARAGLSRETVSREIKKLARAGLVTHHAGQFIIKDIAAFEDKLGKIV